MEEQKLFGGLCRRAAIGLYGSIVGKYLAGGFRGYVIFTVNINELNPTTGSINNNRMRFNNCFNGLSLWNSRGATR